MLEYGPTDVQKERLGEEKRSEGGRRGKEGEDIFAPTRQKVTFG